MEPIMKTRSGRRAAGVTLLSVPVPLALKKAITAISSREDMSMSAWVRKKLYRIAYIDQRKQKMEAHK